MVKDDVKMNRKERKVKRAKQISEILRIVKDTNHHIESIHLRIMGGGDGQGSYERVKGVDVGIGQDLRETERRNRDLEQRIETLGGGGGRSTDRDKGTVRERSKERGGRDDRRDNDRRSSDRAREDKAAKDKDDERRRERERDRQKDDSVSISVSNSRDWISNDKKLGPSREVLRAREQLKAMKIQVGLQYTTYDRAGKQGVHIDDVVRDTAAADAGLRKGDIVLSVDGDPVKNRDAFTRKFKMLVAGDRVKLRLERRSSTMNIDLVIGADGTSMREIARLAKIAEGGDTDAKDRGSALMVRERERSRERERNESPPRGRQIGRDDSLTDRDRSRSRGRDAAKPWARGNTRDLSSRDNSSLGGKW
jgi:hypothetical protein